MKPGVGSTLLPTGTLTFWFTDVEKSTSLIGEIGDVAFAEVLDRHQQLIRAAVTEHGGYEVSTEGDSHFVVFPGVLDAVNAAVAVQRAISASAPDQRLGVRIGMHTGTAVQSGDNYVGADVHRASRIADSGHGGQILVSDVTVSVVGDQMPPGVTTRSLGRYQLAGFSAPMSIHQLVLDDFDGDFPALRARPVESRLPAPLSEFVGREAEIEEGVAILEQSRLLTLTGPGGTGKTRLALEIARSVEGEYSDGAFFVPLASITDTAILPVTIAGVLGLTSAGGVEPYLHLVRYLAEHEILIVLDNFEQLLDGATVVTDLLAAASGLSVIITSRSPLRVAGERELPVQPLSVPQSDGADAIAASDGVKLFVRRAQAVLPEFVMTDENLATISQIARSVDGLPLAIELAASRLRTLTPEALLTRLDNQLLAGRSPDMPARQQTIVNTIGWSYDLLSEDQRRLFEQASVFSGSFALDQAEVVCDGNVLDGLSDLVDHSLLRQTESVGSPRFRMLSVIREFGYAALVSRGDDGEILDRHARAYLDVASTASDEILSSRQQEWLVRLGADHDNLRAAHDHLLSTGAKEEALLLAARLWRFWQLKGHLREGIDRISATIAQADDLDPAVLAEGYTALGGLHYWRGETEAFEPYQKALELFERVNDRRGIANAMYNLAFPLVYRGEIPRGVATLHEARAIALEEDWRLGVGRIDWALAIVSTFDEDWARAIELSGRALEAFAGLDAPFDAGWARFMLARAYLGAGRPGEAMEALGPALDHFSTVGDVSAMALVLNICAGIAVAIGDRSAASYFLGGADRVKGDTGVSLSDVEINQYAQVVELRANMDDVERAQYDLGGQASMEEYVRQTAKFLG